MNRLSRPHDSGSNDFAKEIPEEQDHRKIDPRNKLNELTAKEWIAETVSVWNQRGLGANHPEAKIERQHPAPFSFTDVATA